MQRTMFFVIVLTALINCSTKSSEIKTNAPSVDSLSNGINGKLITTIPVRSFFKEGAITKLPSGDMSLKYLIPVAFYVDSINFYIPDRSRSEIRVLNRKGEYVSSIKTGLKDFAFYKLVRIGENWYALDINEGLKVFDKNMKIVYQEEKTIDFHIDHHEGNIYFENTLNDQKAILDRKGLLKEPYQIPYLSSYVDKSTLIGLKMLSDTEWQVEEVDLKSKRVVTSFSLKTECDMCFILPSFLNRNVIVSSTQKSALKDQVSVVGVGGEIKNYNLEYPVKVNTLISDESAGYTYAGFIYYYHAPSKVLYSLCTDKEFIRVFSFNLSLID